MLFAGLKGAVPILLGSFMLTAARGRRAHASTASWSWSWSSRSLVQGSLVPTVAGLLRLPMRMVEPEPWALGVRLRDEPAGVHRLTVEAGSDADGEPIEAIASLRDEVWVCFVVRDFQLLPVREGTALLAGDEVVVLADPSLHAAISAAFRGP